MSGWSTLMRQATAICGLLAVALGVVLMTVKHEVQSLEEELSQINHQIVAERQAVKVLKAEFSLLAEPDRLRQLAAVHLGLQPIEPNQLTTIPGLERPSIEHDDLRRMTGESQLLQNASEFGGMQ